MDDFVIVHEQKQTQMTNQYYTAHGAHDSLDVDNNPVLNEDSDKTLAKKIIRSDGTIKYTIKLSSEGKLLNPFSIYGQEKNSTFLDRVCRSNSKFKEVNQKSFDLYLKFLKTKNNAWLLNAEREVE